MIGQTLSYYRILEKLGEGGMAEVYLAHDTRLDRRVAIKLLPAHLAADVVARERLRREALDHPFICKIFGVARKQSWPPRLTGSTATPSPVSDARGYLWHRPEKVLEHVLGHLAAHLVAVAHRVPPVQAGPNACVVDLAHECIQVVIGPLGLNQLRDGSLAGRNSPGDLVGAKEPCYRVRHGGRQEAVRRGVLGVVHREEWRPGGIRVGVRVTVSVGSRDRRPGPPISVEVLGIETRDESVGPGGVHDGEEPGRIADVQTTAHRQVDEISVPVHIAVLRPEVGDVGLLGGAYGAV